MTNRQTYMKDSESELTGDLDGILQVQDFNANRGNPIMALTAQCATHSKGQFWIQQTTYQNKLSKIVKMKMYKILMTN